jgi:hypothetical protein
MGRMQSVTCNVTYVYDCCIERQPALSYSGSLTDISVKLNVVFMSSANWDRTPGHRPAIRHMSG